MYPYRYFNNFWRRYHVLEDYNNESKNDYNIFSFLSNCQKGEKILTEFGDELSL